MIISVSHKVKGSRASILDYIDQHGPSSVRELVRVLGIKSRTVEESVARLCHLKALRKELAVMVDRDGHHHRLQGHPYNYHINCKITSRGK